MPENPSNSSESISNENVARILALLRTGDQKIGSTRVDNAILIVGKSGSGKTTLTNFLAGNNEDLISEELGQDTGEFIIRDKNNKISSGNSTIISKTIFPEVIYDRETKTAYIDCPGFNDRGRNEAYDIAEAYFIKKALENVKNIKIVLTANYPSLQSGVSRDDFPHLLERVTTLIKNIDRYVDSVALVATKVHNSYTKRKIQGQVNLVLVPDKLVIENIAKFLMQVEGSLKNIQNSETILKSNSTLSENGEFFDNSRKLLDALLQKKGTEYARLGLFRRPDAAGPVSEIELLQNGKTILKRMLENNLSYAPVDLVSIGYAVSDKSKNIIRELVEEINKSIVYDMSQIKDMLIDLFKQLENDFYDDDIYVLKEHLENWSITLAKISAINESANANELVSLMEKNFPESCKRACAPIFDDIKKLGKFVRFLQDVNENQVDSFAWKWVGELREAIAYVENSLKWYNFLIALYDRLSDYEVRKNIKHIPLFESKSGRLENFADFSEFFNEISNSGLLTVQYLKELQKLTIDDIKVRYFDQVIESTLQKSVHFSHFNDPGPRLRIIGEYVRISSVMDVSSNFPESKSVQVLATHTVFIDADMTKENDISIIAPRWVIIGSRVINLNGSPGEDWIPDKASNCSYDGCNGINGSPGKPGRSAGHFFGLGDEFENASQLQIQAIGGAGGMGQRGGDGKKGASGSTYDMEKSKKDLYCSSGQNCSIRISNNGYYGGWDMYLTIYGTAGGRGGDAGRGGAPGLGGFAGNITIIGVGKEKPAILQKMAKGNDGEFGLHGTCGEGGEGGYNRVSKVCVNCYYSDRDGRDSTYNDGKQPDGDKGTCLYFSSVENSNLAGRADPATINFLHSPALVISDLRNELVKNFDNCVRKSHSLKFYRILQREDISKYDNIDGIFSEFKQLEQLYNRFPLNVSNALYESISRRIEGISKQSDNSLNADNIKSLEFLSSAVSSKLIRLKKNPHSKLAFNYRDYFDVLKTADEEKIDRYFINRAKKEIELAEDMVKIVSSDIFHATERTISEICSFSSNGDLEKLKHNLLKLKLFSISKLIDDILDLVTSLTKVSLDPVQTIHTTKILPSDADGSMIEAKLAVIKKPTEKGIDAIEGAILNEIRSLQSLGDEFDLAIDQLRDVEANLRPRSTVMDPVTSTPMFFNASDQIQAIRSINSALLMNYGPKVNESVINFENDVKVIQWNVDLHNALAKADFNGTDLTSFIDYLREHEINFDETIRDALDLLKSVIVPLIRMSRTGDFYGPKRKVVSVHLAEIKSIIHTLVSQFGIDEEFLLIVENLEEIFNQLVTIVDEVLPAQHNRAVLNSLHSLLKMKNVQGDHVQNYFTKVINADKLFYEYEHLIDACKTSIYPFDILTNRKLAFPATPHVDDSSMQHQSIIAANIEQLEKELDSWEKRMNNVTTSEEFNSGNDNGAFFVWRYDPYEDSIRKLLRGRAVVLKASLDDKVADVRQWLKFDNIGLRFTSTNSTVQQSLDEDLKYFNVSMTHMGDSHFSLCNSVRLVRHDVTRFSRNLNETTAQVIDPINSSLKPVLSPFATWIFKLHPLDEDVTFSILNPYRKLPIGIELEGNATFVKSVNKTMCQKIVLSDFDIHQLPPGLENDQEVAKNISGFDQPSSTTLTSSSVADQLVSSTEITSTYSNTLERKKRDIGSSSSVPDNRGFNWWNPFNYFSSVKPNPSKFELPSKILSLGQNEEHSPNVDYSPPLNINGALALIDFVVRNITKIKPYRSMEKSMSAEEARVIALNIIEELENMLSQLPEEKRISMSDWQEKDPVQLLGQLEKNILTGDLSSVKEILFDLVPLDIPDDELDSLLGRHLGNAEIQRSYKNTRDVVPDGRDHLSGVLIDHAGIPLVNESLNRTLLN